jgi:hypothetical protein
MNTDWILAGVRSFTSNGIADVLWENTSTGEVGAWVTGGGWLELGTAPMNTGWMMVGEGDYAGTTADVAWENTITGQVGAWITGGGGWQNLGTV